MAPIDSGYNSKQDMIRKSGFIHDSPKDDPYIMGLTVGGQYTLVEPTLADGDFTTFRFNSTGKLLVDTELTLDPATGITINNVKVFSTNGLDTGLTYGWAYTNGGSLAALSELWQGFGGYDATGDKFYAFPLSVDDSAMPATPVFVGVGGEYRAVATTYADGDATVLQTDINGYLKTRPRGYDSGTDSQKIYDVNPLNSQYVVNTIAEVTGKATGTTYYYFVDMNNYKHLFLHWLITSADGTDTLTIFGSADPDAAYVSETTVPSGDWIDITSALTGSASFTATNSLLVDTALPVSKLYIKIVRAGGTGVGAWTIHAKKMY